jgi:membrane protease YdiL (CAAX protease family)
MSLVQLWSRIPVLLRAVVTGPAVGLLASLSWSRLVGANIRHGYNVPWAVPIMIVLLAAWWWYFAQGRGWPRSTGEMRRASARANPVPDRLWGHALGAGVLGLFCVLLFQGVLARLVTLPHQQEIDPSQFPLPTVIAWVVMSALVAGVVEETAFRGYMQGAIERRHGPVIAILVSGTVFGLAHFSHPEVGIVLLPYYLAVSAVYGSLAYATNSTIPGMVLHSGGNMLSLFGLFTRGRSEWQLGVKQSPLVWQSGIDMAFVVNLILLLGAATGTWLVFRSLIQAASRRTAPDG